MLKTEQQLQNDHMNDFYLHEVKEKENFKMLKGLIENKIRSGKVQRICDVGCATGDLIAYLKREFGDIDINYTGVDVSEKLLDEAKNRLPDIEFIRGDIIDGISIKESDIVLFFGVISFFDNVETVFENLFRLSSRNGGGICVRSIQ